MTDISFTGWIRLEPISRDGEMHEALAAKVADPLWMLFRQWQLGEFNGEDSGSIALARTVMDKARLETILTPVNIYEPLDYDPIGAPLEPLIEQGGAGSNGIDLRTLAELSIALKEILSYHGLGAIYFDLLAKGYVLGGKRESIAQDEQSDFLDKLGGSIVDPRSFRIMLGTENDPLPNDRLLRERINRWAADMDKEVSGASPFWKESSLNYAFSTTVKLGDEEITLEANDHHGGAIDWYSFDVVKKTKNEGKEISVIENKLPVPVMYKGMPRSRYWEFEDASVNFGTVNASLTDMSKMLLIEYALSSSNDFFVIPMNLEVGTLCRVRSLLVRDTFGMTFLIRPASSIEKSPWNLFTISSHGENPTQEDPGLFLVAPSLVHRIKGESMEEVDIVRDEIANLAWAIESVVPNGIRGGKHLGTNLGGIPSQSYLPPKGESKYRLMTKLPENWFPLQSNAGNDPADNVLEIMNLKNLMIDQSIEPKGKLLHGSFKVDDDAVPREGIKLIRGYESCRWTDGSVFTWISMQGRLAKGERSSGLTFDYLEDADKE